MNAKPRVGLRIVQDSDLDLFFEYQADAGAAAMAAVPTQERARFDAHWAMIRRNPTGRLRTVLVDGAVAGHLACWQDGEQWLIGYWIGRGYWGRGVATQALRLFVDEVPTRPLRAHVAAHNAGSIRVLQKCGFRHTPEQEGPTPDPHDGIEELHFVLARPAPAPETPSPYSPQIEPNSET